MIAFIGNGPNQIPESVPMRDYYKPDIIKILKQFCFFRLIVHRHTFWDLVRGPFGVRDPFGVRTVRGSFGVRSGSFRGPFGVRSESVRNSFGVRSGSVRGPSGMHSESIWGPFGPISEQNFRSPNFKI